MMSKLRYDWWGYVKGMIRRYPELCEKEQELHTVSITRQLFDMPRGKGRTADTTADAAIRELPDINRRELKAVRSAIEETKKLDTGEARLYLIRLVFWKRSHTLEGAALQCHISYITACRWHRDFIYSVAYAFGLL